MSGSPPAQTPGFFIKAGDTGAWDQDCINAVMKVGFHPDDFGSYDHTLKKIREAKDRVIQAQVGKKYGRSDMPTPPLTDHDRLLNRCQAGHLTQNAVFQRNRYNNCQNERAGDPPSEYPGADGYHHDGAPCGPHPVNPGGRKAPQEGTTHWAVGRNEANIANQDGQTLPPGASLTADQINENARGTALRTAAGALPDDMQGTNGRDRNRKNGEASARASSAAALQAQGAGGGSTAGADAATISDADKQKAADCIEAFRQRGLEKMREKVAHDYSPENYPATQAALDQRANDAEAAVGQAQARRAAAVQARLDRKTAGAGRAPTAEQALEERRAFSGMSSARQDLDQARGAAASGHCLADQARRLNQQGQPWPSMSGSVPGQGRAYPDGGPPAPANAQVPGMQGGDNQE